VNSEGEGTKPTLVDEMGREALILEADVPAGKSAVHIIDKVRREGVGCGGDILLSPASVFLNG
jgi:hypothetical protein